VKNVQSLHRNQHLVVILPIERSIDPRYLAALFADGRKHAGWVQGRIGLGKHGTMRLEIEDYTSAREARSIRISQ
jgi:hypothetical protein